MPNLAEQEYCTGCTACASACSRDCITMASDENGFLSPVIDTEKCVSCSLCEKACPIITPLSLSKIAPKAYAAYCKDEAVRMQSSSGGIFTEIAKTVLADGGAVYGAAYNAQFEVVHICAETEADLAKLRGAKYAQSDLRGIFTNVKAQLEQGRKVLFSGTPCQVAGLKSFLQKDYVPLPKHTFYVDNIYVYTPLPKVKNMYYMDVDFYRYFIGRDDQSVNEKVMIGRIDQQIRVNKIMIDQYDLWKISNKRLRKYMFNYLEIITVVSTIMLIRSGTEENLNKKRELWKYIKDKDIRLFHHLRRGIMGNTMNLPGKSGRKISVAAYKISQKVVGFN